MQKKLLFLLPLVFVTGCAATVYTTEDFSAYQAEHETTAILPYKVDITLKELPEGVTQEDLSKMERDEGYAFQKQLYSQFLSRYAKGEYTVKFQDVDRTNVLLSRADIDYDNLTDYTKDEIATILEVDCLISGNITRSRPMSTGAAVWSTLLFGFGTTNEVNVNMTIHDGTSGGLLWSYDHQLAGGLGSTPERVAKSLMKDVARKFPYQREDK